MKSIELTEEHKAKILEMCSKLFPKYNFVFLVHGIGRSIPVLKYKKKKEHHFNSEYIHWFEFCIKHLIPKLDDSIQSIVDSRGLFCELPNPIDYLYEKFKQKT